LTGEGVGTDGRWALEYRLETSHHDLEATLHAVISALAGEKGVDIKETKLTFVAPSGRQVDFRLSLTAKAMIMSADLVVHGKAEIGDDLNARVTEIEIDGDGMVAGLAKGIIEPQFAKIRGKAYPIARLDIPGLVVRDITVSATEGKVQLAVQLAAK